MASIGKVIGITAAVGAAGFGAYYLISRSMEIDTFINNVKFNVKPTKVKLKGTKLSVFLTIEIINPSDISISFQKPTVWIKYDGTDLAQSKQSKDKVTIEKQGKTKIKDIELQIDMISNIPTFINIFTTLFSDGNKVSANDFVTKLTTIKQRLVDNMPKLLGKLEVTLLTRVGKTPINPTFRLAEEQTEVINE